MVFNRTKLNKRKGERGSIMIMTVIFMVLLFLMLGMAIDLSRVYMVRAEMQNAADAAALAAAKELNGGGSGIDAAVARAQAVLNTHGFAKAGVGLATISFAASLHANPYIAAYDSSNAGVTTASAKAVADTIGFVKVTTQPVSMNVLFAVQALGTTHSQTREAVAGVSVGVSGICDFFPAAVGLNDRLPLTPEFDPPVAGATMNLNFSQGTGNEAVVNHEDYIILEIPNITGNGTPETAVLTAGAPNICKSLGDNINMTPSSNTNNGPRNSGDGINTRFGLYANGYGNALNADTFPPDTNVTPDINSITYLGGPPIPNDRRMIVAPIILPGTYPAYTTDIKDWGVFFIIRPAVVNNGACDPAEGCGSFHVEYVRKAQTGIVFGPPSCQSQLNAPVLYK